MPIVLQSNHALLFDGVSDGVIIPQGGFSKLGQDYDGTDKSAAPIVGKSVGDGLISDILGGELAIEAWVIPDCGGIILSKGNQFRLTMGTIDTPGPIEFEANLDSEQGKVKVMLRSALPDTSTTFDGHVYPVTTYGGLDDSYNRFVSSKDKATSLSLNQRPLYHVVASLSKGNASLYVNGDLIAQQAIPTVFTLLKSSEHLYIGGKGGEFRGIIEGIHVANVFKEEMVGRNPPLVGDNTLSLFRFEEPISPLNQIYTISSTDTSYSDAALTEAHLSVITIPVAEAKILADTLTGTTVTATYVDFTVSPYSTGNYSVIDRYSIPGTTTKHSIPHVPYNLLINPGSVNQITKKPNQKPPERVRLHRINLSSGELLVSSVHLDFKTTTNTDGLRGLLHSTHTSANGANNFVVISADSLIENGTGQPYQPPHLATQLLDRTGQMLVDEGIHEQNAMVYSSRMSTTTSDANNPYAVAWPSTLDESFQVGHSGRHTLNHVKGHHYLRNMPRANDELLDQQTGNADILTLHYDATAKGIGKMFPMNSQVDYYRDIARFEIQNVVNTGIPHEIVSNGLGTIYRELIAIGGAKTNNHDFDCLPFILKGPAPVDIENIDSSTRKFHLHPSSQSRVALLHVPTLASRGLAPYVEVHYNAIDFTGASMSKTAPMLMVEKTVPAGSVLVANGVYVYDDIATDVAAGNALLYSPGGFIDIGGAVEGNMGALQYSHSLVGDNSEGYEPDVELDERYTPPNFTAIGTTGNSTPQNVTASHTTKAEHDSVFHRIFMERVKEKTEFNRTTEFARRTPHEVIGSPSAGQFDIGITSSASNIHEMFDVIDNVEISHKALVTHRFFIQPSDRRRTNQLQYIYSFKDRSTSANFASLMYLMSRNKLRAIEEIENDDGRFTVVHCVGLSEVATSRSINELAAGSPDSHVVKEIDANAPVVSVTLGGVGQGAYDTKPSFDPSVLARLPYSSRRGFSCLATKARVDLTSSNPVQFIEIAPLNNGATDLKSWGTYPFPEIGKIYLKNGAYAEYQSKTGVSFHFTDSTIGTNRFVLPNGASVATFQEWLAGTGLSAEASSLTSGNSLEYNLGEVLMGDGHFYIENLNSDGTTVNDRMFQSMDNIAHDYQLGTQFASTRAMVEIPLFKGQFFPDRLTQSYPSPDNSLKLHIDPTMTAHTWNPSPVGRRYQDIPPADRSAYSAYAKSVLSNKNNNQAVITSIENASNTYKIYISNKTLFPSSVTGASSFYNVDNVLIYRRAFLASGEWIIYNNDPFADGYLQLPSNEDSYFSKDFFTEAETGVAIMVGNTYHSEVVVPLTGDSLNPAADYEGRGEYYQDAASVMTQGGNVDYGLRQYVSAVEFRAGPLSNPHAARVESGRAKGVILGVEPILAGTNYTGFVQLVMSREDVERFPNVDNPPSFTALNATYEYEMGQPHYTLEVGANIFTYFGEGDNKKFVSSGSVANVADSLSSIIVQTKEHSSVPSYLNDGLVGETATLTKKGFDVHFSTDKYNILLDNTLNLSHSARPIQSSNPITIESKASDNASIDIKINSLDALTQANSIGLNIQEGDWVYGEYHNGNTPVTSTLLGQVARISEGMIISGSVSAGRATTIIFENAIPSANNSALATALAAGGITKVFLRVGCHDIMKSDDEAILNRTWLYPFAQGGLRQGDTIWSNMTYNNPHAMQGMFSKSRGVLNESLVWLGFNGGKGLLNNDPRNSIPLENFLIGDSCVETARNYVQHVNKTIELNYANLSQNSPPTVAYLDPYLANAGHARVLLYDVAHDREFISFQDIHMQVQTSAKAAELGFERHSTALNLADGTDEIDLGKYSILYNGGGQNPYITQIDVANGYPSQSKYIRNNQQSNFMESAYAHNIAGNMAAALQSPSNGIVTSLKETGTHWTNRQNGTGYSTANGVATTSTFGSGLTVNIVAVAGQIVTIVIASAGIGYKDGREITVSTGGANAKFIATTTSSGLIANLTNMSQTMLYGKAHGHFVHTGYHTGGPLGKERTLGDSVLSRTQNATAIPYHANKMHEKTRKLFSSEKDFIKALMQHRVALGGTVTLKQGGTGYNYHTSYTNWQNIKTTTNGKGAGLTVDVVVHSSNGRVISATINRLGDSNYKTNDIIFIGDRYVGASSTSSATIGGNGDGSFILNLKKTHIETSTLFDTPDGTRVIPAFLALKGIRSETLDLTNMTSEARLQHLPQWTQMDFTRRLTIDLGEVPANIEGQSVETAALEVVRMINQAGAKNGRTHSMKTDSQFPVDVVGEGDLSTTSSTHNPAVWWDTDKAFTSHDKGTHMGYVRAHIGRLVQSSDGDEGYSIIIHSTVPGASGRNFAVWLDNSKGQVPYKPDFLIGHGGRFRTFWCQPDELSGENMHPAPMPLNKHGRPFAPITSLRQYTQPDGTMQRTIPVGDFVDRDDETSNPEMRAVSASSGGGQNHNTINDESFEVEGFNTSFTEGLRVGKTAVGRINFGGLVSSGVPGFAPDAGKWGFGRKGDNRFVTDYGAVSDIGLNLAAATYTSHILNSEVSANSIGDSDIYGLRLKDHRGKTHGLRYIYKSMGENFALDSTTLPDTLDSEIVIHFNHKDVSYGGFTIGSHMAGLGDPTGRFPAIPNNAGLASWRGNKWGAVPAPAAAYNTDLVYDKTAETITLTLYTPYTACPHHDVLGYMGFPLKDGVLHVSDPYNDMGTAASISGGSGYTASQTTQPTTVSGGSGSGMTLNVTTNSSQVVTAIVITSVGDGGYINGETITVVGLGSNDATFVLNNSLAGNWGNMFSYTHRTRSDKDGAQVFFGVKGSSFTSLHSINGHSETAPKINFSNSATVVTRVGTTDHTAIHALVTPAANWTTLVTDELMAAVTAFTINLPNPNIEEGVFFDCTEMYASDGKTFGEWGITPESIKIRAYNLKSDIPPISDFFQASLSQDMGIKASHLEFGEVEAISVSSAGTSVSGSSRPVGDDLLDDGREVACGYVPSTLLQIFTKSKGYNANTATPVFVDSNNNPIDTDEWGKNLAGENYTGQSGDLILPNCDNPSLKINVASATALVASTNTIWHLCRPAGKESTLTHIVHGGSYDYARVDSFGNKTKLFYQNEYALVEGTNHAAPTLNLSFTLNSKTDDWPTSSISGTPIMQRYGDKRAFLFAGVRSLGSVHSKPVVFFRGGRDSPDNYVPLYFGGGFSGVTLDINDGTQNDYSEHNTHPYANGPTGAAGIQNANEILSSFSTLDCNAILAFFPATALLKQHRGSIAPPVYNKDNILSPDIKLGQQAVSTIHPNAAPYSAGVHYQVPSPMVLRFAHPTARYNDHRDGVENKTTYIIFGPGQAFPLSQEIATPANTFEPHPGKAVSTGNTWSSVPHMTDGAGDLAFLPNHLHNSAGHFMPEIAAVQLAKHRYHYRQVLNWEASVGTPNVARLFERPENGRNYGTPFTQKAWAQYGVVANFNDATATDYATVQPSRHAVFTGGGMVTNADLCWHMDSGNHPGGSWMDNQITMNPPRETGNQRVAKDADFTQINPTAFRVAGTLATRMLYSNDDASSPAFAAETLVGADVDHEYIVVDATRCQNGEELACLLGAAINTFPGKGALKALGGTFMPSMGNSSRQDRYGWVKGLSTAIPSGIYGTGTPHATLGYSNVKGAASFTREAGTTQTFTATFTSGATQVTRTGAAASLETVGQAISGTGIAAHTHIISISGTTIGLSLATTAAHTGDNNTLTIVTNTVGNIPAASQRIPDCFIDLQIAAANNIANRAIAKRIPASGWLRTEAAQAYGGVVGSAVKTTAFASYHSRATYQIAGSNVLYMRFYLSHNKLTGRKTFEDSEVWRQWSAGKQRPSAAAATLPHPAPSTGTSVWIWSKSGTIGVDNSQTARYTTKGIGAAHFSGIADAIDRTKPVGAVGWHGERYSYLNTLGVTQNGSTTFSAGLSAWHPKLGFSPYGGASSCATILGHLPHTTPLPNSPESMPPTDVPGRSLTNFPAAGNLEAGMANALSDAADTAYGGYVTGFADGAQFNNPPMSTTLNEIQRELINPNGTYARSLLVVAYEGELSLVARKDRDGFITTGDYLRAGGTTQWDERIHAQDRFTCTANAGPNVEALIVDGTAPPTIANYAASNALDGSPFNAEVKLHGTISADTQLSNAEPCRAEIGDLFFDIDKNVGVTLHEDAGTIASRNLSVEFHSSATVPSSANLTVEDTPQSHAFWVGDVNGYDTYKRSPHKNFSTEHVVWKRMDGGSLTLPASNARGLGAVPWVTRVVGSNAHTMGEKLYGNVRFSFETTNSAMLPILQAQEIAHPQLAAKHPVELKNALSIPNEEIQFEDISVIDDTGQIHTLEGGSPLGVVIRAFRPVTNRLASGLQPSPANSGLSPNLEIQLPDPDSIPGNILIRSGFDAIQGYQNETVGDGGMIHPDLGASHLGHLFDNVVKSPRTGPTMNEVGWEHISQDGDFPESTRDGWVESTGNNTLRSSYEQQDRALYFHITKMGHSHTEKFPTTYTHAAGVVTQALALSSFVGTTLTANATVTASVFAAGFGTKEVFDEGSGKQRRFIRISNPTGESVVASYTGISGATFTGVVGDIDFAQFLVKNASVTLTIKPSYYVPAGSTRIYAARRLRDHAEVSGNSPDMAHTEYWTGNALTTVHSRYSRPQLTPMPLPRMGHHFVNATMPMMPGHWAHPSYQGLYERSNSENLAKMGDEDYTTLATWLESNDGTTNNQTTINSNVTKRLFPLNPALRVGSLTATPSGPSDIHGGAFTLMFETKIKYDGYGILASKGTAGGMNKLGGHSIVLEAGANYTHNNHFPDPAEVGAYQIIIQPNLRSHQVAGFHRNNATATGLPAAGTALEGLTNQQVNLVVGIKYDEERHASLTNSANVGGMTLVLAEATLADVRGCEIFINEVILDHEPDHGSQFTNIPPMLLYNPLGVQGSESPTFTRKGHAYQPEMFKDATPGHTIGIPWWSIMHQNSPENSASTGFRHLTQYRIDNYYQFCRASYGSVAAQITLAGYPSIYPDIYSKIMENVSLSPTCVLTAATSNSTTVTVDDASLFPEVPYYDQKLQYVDTAGETVSLAYTKRHGTTFSSATMNIPRVFVLASATSIPNNTKLTLSKSYSNASSSDLFKKPSESILAQSLPQLLAGTRDTNSLFSGDAFICAWHPNLGRPHTHYSDASRTWIVTGTNHTADRAINKAAYNSMPQHYETIHYHEVNYAASHGPFALKMKTPKPPEQLPGTFQSVSSATITMSTTVSGVGSGEYVFSGGRLLGKVSSISGATIVLHDNIFEVPASGDKVYVGATGELSTAAQIQALTGYSSQGNASRMLTGFWPCGSRGGPLVSRLDGYAATSAGWHIPQEYSHGAGTHWKDADDDGSYAVSAGITSSAASNQNTRTYPFGYRFGLRQPWNRPQWGHYGMRAYQEADEHSGASNFTVGYKAGPLVEYEAQGSNGWVHAGGSSHANLPTTYVGILERHTTAAGMLNADKYEWQVRYSEGRRMTRGFGCAIRTVRNPSTVIRDWWGDAAGKGLADYKDAVSYYLVDWWGNTRGEDVRRSPVRSFGISPSWDAGDAYEYDRTNGRTPYARIWNNNKPIFNLKGIAADSDTSSGAVLSSPSITIPRFGGRKNTANNNDANTLVDVFAPTNSLRVGDMGNGRGVRYPTQFNEDILVELSAVYENSGVVLSSNTAEPSFGEGLLRPRNDVLQPGEVKRGISTRLEIEEDGLLKPEATVSDKVETLSGTSVHKDAISRSSPRIGIDGDTIESLTGSSTNMVAINSEAHSLHTNRGVGQRVVLHGGMQSGTQTLGDYDLTSLSFAAQPHGGVMRFSHTSNFKPMGGNYILETRSFANPFSDSNWGRTSLSGSQKTSNPYQTNIYDSRASSGTQTNKLDDTIRFLVRPVRLLDNQHIAVFRPLLALHGNSKQAGGTAYSATAGGKYGMFTYEVLNGRAGLHTGSTTYMRTTNPDSNAPYQPVYLVDSSHEAVPTSKGPKLPGTEVAGFDKTTLKSSVTRLVITENTLQHFRSDAPRRTGVSKDYTVKPRFSQSLHGKGHKEDVEFSTSDHSGDA